MDYLRMIWDEDDDPDGMYIIVVFDFVDEDSIRVVTAYEVLEL